MRDATRRHPGGRAPFGHSPCRAGTGLGQVRRRDATKVNVDNFVRAETDRMFAATQEQAAGPNRFMHNREPAQVDNQPVIRMNRDTLYGFAVVDLSAGTPFSPPSREVRSTSSSQGRVRP